MPKMAMLGSVMMYSVDFTSGPTPLSIAASINRATAAGRQYDSDLYLLLAINMPSRENRRRRQKGRNLIDRAYLRTS